MKKLILFLFVGLLGTACSNNDEPKDDGQSSDIATDRHECVDLGLSVKWATCNIGAEKPSDFGYYFAWGETVPPPSDNKGYWSEWGHVSYSSLNSQGVIDSNGNLTPKYDAATANWGGKWRMPTKDEIEELLNKCTWFWTTQDDHKGYKVTGPNGNYIFLPAAGFFNHHETGREFICGYYWSATAYRDEIGAHGLFFEDADDVHYCNYESRSLGQSVRPVTE